MIELVTAIQMAWFADGMGKALVFKLFDHKMVFCFKKLF